MSRPADVAARLRASSCTRSVWFWTALGTASAILLLWGGSQLAKANGQNVEWYTGFGQWLGALGSLIAAVVALWIATTDRQRADAARRAEREETDRDLAREAGLVRVTAGEMKVVNAMSPIDGRPGISVDNRRTSRIYDLEIARIVNDGVSVPNPEFFHQVKIDPPQSEWGGGFDSLRYLGLKPNHLLVVYPKGPDEDIGDVGEPPEYAAVRYTDQSGRRWEVDTNGGLARKVS